MRTRILLCTLLALTGCSKLSVPEKGGKILASLKEPDSPIIIADGGSIHVRKPDGMIIFAVLPYQYGEVQIDPMKTLTLVVQGCKAAHNPPSCTIASEDIKFKNSWILNLYDTNGMNAAALTYPSPLSASRIRVQSKVADYLSPEDPNQYDPDAPQAAGLVQMNHSLAGAGLSIDGGAEQPIGCTPAPGLNAIYKCTTCCRIVITEK